MSIIKELLNQTEPRDVTVAIRLNDLKEWTEDLVTSKLSLIEQVKAEQSKDEYLTPDATCKKAGVVRSTLTRWQRRGYLIPYKIGGKCWYRKSEIEAIMNQKAVS